MAAYSRRALSVAGALLLAGMACNLNFGAAPAESDLRQVETTVAGTLIAQLTLAPGPGQVQPTEQPANTPEPLPSATITLTPTDTSTPTPSVPMISVTVNTNCRFGPGSIYDYLGALLEGETAEISGTGPHGRVLVHSQPGRPGPFLLAVGRIRSAGGQLRLAADPDPSALPHSHLYPDRHGHLHPNAAIDCPA